MYSEVVLVQMWLRPPLGHHCLGLFVLFAGWPSQLLECELFFLEHMFLLWLTPGLSLSQSSGGKFQLCRLWDHR